MRRPSEAQRVGSGVGDGAGGRAGAGVGVSGGPTPVLLATGSAWLADQVQRCAAAAGVAVDVVPAGGGALEVVARARGRLVLLGEDAAREVGEAATVPAPGPADAGGPGSTPALAPFAPRPLCEAPAARVVVVADAEAPDVTWRHALHLGAQAVLRLPVDAEALVEALLDAADPRRADGCLVGVVGGRGGAGASCLAAGLAVAAARRPAPAGAVAGEGVRSGQGARVLLVDADPLGGGLDVLLGLEEEEGLRWPDLASVRGVLRPAVLEGTLPRTRGVDVLAPAHVPGAAVPEWAATPPVAALTSVLTAARRSHHLTVVDLPRRQDAAWSAVVGALDALVVVVPLELRAGIAAHRLLRGAAPAPAAAVHLVVRSPRRPGRGPGSGLTAASMAEALGMPVAAVLPTDGRWAARLHAGAPFARGGPPLRCAEVLLPRLWPLSPPSASSPWSASPASSTSLASLASPGGSASVPATATRQDGPVVAGWLPEPVR